MKKIKYNKDISINITEKTITIYENKERDFIDNYTVNKILLEVEIEKDFVDITYISKSKGFITKRMKSANVNLLEVDKKHLIKKVMELIKDDLKIELD